MKRFIGTSNLLLAGLVLSVSLGLAPSATAQELKEPSWPQKFEVSLGEHASFGFVVTQPGEISVTVQSQGAPVTVILKGPLAQPVQQRGTGAIHLSYKATPADVQKSSLWFVYVAEGNGTDLRPRPNQRAQAVASGTISIQHPPADFNIARAELAKRKMETADKLKKRLEDLLVVSQKTSADGKPRVVRPYATPSRQALLAALEPSGPKAASLPQPADAAKQSLSNPTSGTGGGSGPKGGTGTGTGCQALLATTTKADIRAKTLNGEPCGPGQPGGRGGVSGGATTSTSAYDAVNRTPAGFHVHLTGIANPDYPNTAPYEPSWCLQSVCTSAAKPGDWVELSGSVEYSDEVHVILGNSDNLLKPVWTCNASSYEPNTNYWSGGVMPAPPSVTTPAWIYVKRGDQHSNLLPISFGPPVVIETIKISPLSARNSIVSTSEDLGLGVKTTVYPFQGGLYVQRDGGLLVGGRGDDQWFLNKTLLNGWTIVSLDIAAEADQGAGGAYITSSGSAGSANPRLTMHWWVDAWGVSSYVVRGITITGPKGTNYW